MKQKRLNAFAHVKREDRLGMKLKQSTSCGFHRPATTTTSVLTHSLSRTFPEGDEEETVREGFEPDKHAAKQPHGSEQEHALGEPFAIGDDEEAPGGDNMRGESDEAQHWQRRNYDHDGDVTKKRSPQYGSFDEERNVWGSNDAGRS